MTTLLFEHGVHTGVHHGYYYNGHEESVRPGWQRTRVLAAAARATQRYEITGAEVHLFARTARKLHAKIVCWWALDKGAKLDPLIRRMHYALKHLESKDHLQLHALPKGEYELKIEVVGWLADFDTTTARYKRIWA